MQINKRKNRKFSKFGIEKVCIYIYIYDMEPITRLDEVETDLLMK